MQPIVRRWWKRAQKWFVAPGILTGAAVAAILFATSLLLLLANETLIEESINACATLLFKISFLGNCSWHVA
jgi:hypothetical protein